MPPLPLRWIAVGIAAVPVVVLAAGAARSVGGDPLRSAPALSDAARAYAALPASFEPNRGQAPPNVRFLARGSGYGMFLERDEVVFATPRADGAGGVVRMRALGANPEPALVGERRLPGKANYLRGRDPQRWRTGLPTYGQVRYRALYPGIDLVFHGTKGRLEYDFVVAPKAEPGAIALAFEGMKRLALGKGGELVLPMPGGTLRQHRPFAYQELDGERRPVPARYVLDEGQVGFALGRYDRTRPLVIDPEIAYTAPLGGLLGHGGAVGVAVDGNGSAYVTGATVDAGGATDAFVAKLNPAGSALEYTTYLGGAGFDFADDLAVDGRGRAYVVGSTQSSDFPTTAGAFQPADPDPRPGFEGMDGFVTKLNSDGTETRFSTYLGGTGVEGAGGVAVDAEERAYVTGFTSSADFPTTAGALATTRHGLASDAFVTKLSYEGAYLRYSTYLGGSGPEDGTDIAVDRDGRAYVTGTTDSGDFPTTPGVVQTSLGPPTEDGVGDAFVSKLSGTGTSLAYSTYLGGTGSDYPFAIAVDPQQRAYVAGYTHAADFPTTPGAFQPVAGPNIGGDSDLGGGDGFVTKLDREGTELKYSTFLGGFWHDRIMGLDVDTNGRAHVAGITFSPDFPVTPDAPFTDGPVDPDIDGTAFVTSLSTSGSALRFSTFLGLGRAEAVALADDGDFYVTDGASVTKFRR